MTVTGRTLTGEPLTGLRTLVTRALGTVLLAAGIVLGLPLLAANAPVTTGMMPLNASALPAQEEDLDCANFDTQPEAQREYDTDPGDPHDLDRDGDGRACENLPTGQDRLNCDDFDSQADAQRQYDADPSDPNRLDGDNDAVPCEPPNGTADGGAPPAGTTPGTTDGGVSNGEMAGPAEPLPVTADETTNLAWLILLGLFAVISGLALVSSVRRRLRR